MAKLTQRIKVTNDLKTFATLWLEPWGEDYGMNPDDEFEIIANEADETFCFHVEYFDKGVKVWVEGDSKVPIVYQKGEELFCGHNRKEETW